MSDLVALVPSGVWAEAAAFGGGVVLAVLALIRKRAVSWYKNRRDTRPVTGGVGPVVRVRALDDAGGIHDVNLEGVPRDDLWYFGDLQDPGWVPMESDGEELDAGFDHRYDAVGGFVGRV